MNDYNAIAGVYDSINSGVDYQKWADAFENAFAKYLKEKPSLLLDLASGTGRLTLEMAKRGYDMIGVDGSPEMLARATDSLYDMIDSGELPKNAPRPLFLCQDMCAFELYGTVGAVTCCLDSLNYLTADGDLKKCFSLVHNYLDPDGLFIFDMNTPYKFENVYGENAYVYDLDRGEAGSQFCVWQNFYDEESKICDFYLTVFEEAEGGKYERLDEEQRERCYSMDEIKNALEITGFELISVASTPEGSEIKDDTPRWHFIARAKK
jgi:SAM-dependent methyltransferase